MLKYLCICVFAARNSWGGVGEALYGAGAKCVYMGIFSNIWPTTEAVEQQGAPDRSELLPIIWVFY